MHSSRELDHMGHSKAFKMDLQLTVELVVGDATGVPARGLLQLLQSGRNMDLSFVVEGKVLRAHRSIVASQCTYFDRLLYGCMIEASSDCIKLEETPWEAFKLILRYMYSGEINTITTIQVVLDLLILSDRYEFNELKDTLESILCGEMNISNVLQFMFYGDTYNAKRLYDYCSGFVDHNAHLVLKSQSLLLLPKENFKALLSRDSFNAMDISIYEAVARWKDFNDFEVSEVTEVFNCVRLSNITSHDLEKIVRPAAIYPDFAIDAAVEQNRDPSRYLGCPRGCLAGSNLLEQRSTAVLHECSNFNPSNDPSTVMPYQREYTLMSKANTTFSAITMKFDEIYIINHVSFNAKPFVWEGSGCVPDKIKNPYMYILEVSKDGNAWTVVIDHSICKCYSTQTLYFPRYAARYLRLHITKALEYLKVRFFNCCLTTHELPFKFLSGGSIAPTKELCPKCITSWTNNKDGTVRCMLTFHQPYHITRIRLRIEGMEPNPDHCGEVAVSIALYNTSRSYHRVCCLPHQYSSDLVVDFEESLVSIVSVHLRNYYNGKTGADHSKMLIDKDLKIPELYISYLAKQE